MEGLGQLAVAAGQQSPFNKAVNFGFQQWGNKINADRRESAFTDYGLPRYMAYSGGAQNMPQQRYQLAGNNLQNIGPVGAKIPFNANPFMRRHGFGIEGPDPSQSPEVPPPSGNFPQSSPQNDSPPPYEAGLPMNMSKEDAISHWWPNGPPAPEMPQMPEPRTRMGMTRTPGLNRQPGAPR
jgi:hypothetical protein